MSIFVLLSLLFLVYEFRNLVNPSKLINLRKKLQELKTIEGEQKKLMSKDIINDSFGIIMTNLVYGIWCLIGMFIFTEWYLFAFMFFFSFFSSFMSNRLLSLEKATLYYKTFDTLISIIILVLILISYFLPNIYKNLI